VRNAGSVARSAPNQRWAIVRYPASSGAGDRARRRLPRFAELWLLYLLSGVLGGIAFGLQGFFAGAYGVSGHDSVQRLAAYPIESQVVLWLAGPAFPFALLVLAVVYQLVPAYRTAPRPWWWSCSASRRWRSQSAGYRAPSGWPTPTH
jgi:hypothetical protein